MDIKEEINKLVGKKKRAKGAGRPKEYLTKEPRKTSSVRLTKTQKANMKKYYGGVQQFIETAYLQLLKYKVRNSSTSEDNH